MEQIQDFIQENPAKFPETIFLTQIFNEEHASAMF